MISENFDRSIPKQFLKYTKNRDEHILSLCANKKVLHIGATDSPFTEERWKRGDLLYVRIGEIASSQLGIDLAETESEFLNSKNIINSKILVRDMNQLQELEFTPDVIIFSDTLEHLMNLETAITNLKMVMGQETILVITVPNTLFFMNFVYAFFKKEHQHPDHSVGFTYKTFTQLINKNNLSVKDFYFTFLEISSDMKLLNWKGKIMYVLVRFMTKISPLYAETLMAVVKNKEH